MKKEIAVSEQKVSVIAEGLYTQWKVRKPSFVERILNLVTRKTVSRPNQNNDTEMLADTGDTRIKLSTIKDKVTIHRIIVGDVSIHVNETLRINDSRSKREFARDFRNIWIKNLKKQT